jgi:transcriptional regulator with XRE-family HTH domain
MPVRSAPRAEGSVDFGKWLKNQLDRRGMNAASLAALMHVAPSTVGRWLSGEWEPKAKRIGRLGKVLDLESDDVRAALGWEPAPKSDDPEWLRQTFNQIREWTPQELQMLVAFVAGVNVLRRKPAHPERPEDRQHEVP